MWWSVAMKICGARQWLLDSSWLCYGYSWFCTSQAGKQLAKLWGNPSHWAPSLSRWVLPEVRLRWRSSDEAKEKDKPAAEAHLNFLVCLVSPVCFLVSQPCPALRDPTDCSPPCASVRGDSPGKNTGVSCHALLQGIFPTQGSNPGLAHCRWILYHLDYQRSPRILQRVAVPFSRGSFWPRNWTKVSWIAGRFFTSWATRGAPTFQYKYFKLDYFTVHIHTVLHQDHRE